MTRPRGRRVLAAMIVLIAAPALVAALDAVGYTAANRSTHSMMSGGVRREYSLHVPSGYDPRRPAPLVISLHPAGFWPAAHMKVTRWNAVADSVGAIVLYPSGLAGGGPTIWREDDPRVPNPDVQFISELIDTIAARFHVDSTRIYADGFSNGGGMAFALSCTLSSRIAAVAMVGPAHRLPFRWCRDTTPVPMMHIHGTADNAAPYEGGPSWVTRHPFPNTRGWVASWARRNHCNPVPRDSAVAPHVVRRSYTGCRDNADVVLITIDGGGHTWPGGTPLPEWFVGTTSTEVDASGEFWRFFSAHPLTTPRRTAP